ncbi:uncharacterized protein LOC126767041 [Bactrocera neohumeralis]|uniref:uncharacterized protein LOC126767041 n=1 Tax=Bactrocera neohumeralis TaxID=98809 RepID=UPI002166117D|nr:uncharacterized protein LOC126767041 [Bactrocera neohumeralis]
MEVNDGNLTIDHVQKPRQMIEVRLNKAPKTSAERGREFRARKALLKQQCKQQQEPDAIVEIANDTSNIVTSNMDILLRHIREVDIFQSSIGDICAAHCVLDDGTNIIMVVVYISPNNTVNNIIKFIYRRLMIYGRVGSEELGENYHTLPLILAGDFNINFIRRWTTLDKLSTR